MESLEGAAGAATGMSEHAAAMKLVTAESATHRAVSDGAWSDPDTWAGGRVPGDGAIVHIPDGLTVEYDVASDSRLKGVRIDGELDFSTEISTRMVVDTVLVTDAGTLRIGSASNPIANGVTADIVVSGGPIDPGADPLLLGRGVVSMGTVEIHGDEKESHLKVAVDPMAGDDTLTLSGPADGWRVGDTIVVAGTQYEGYKYSTDARSVVHHLPEDEIRVITAIDGAKITLDAPLAHDHDTPRDDLKTSVANYTRSVTIRSEDPDAPVSERGHVMFMHSDDVDVRYASFVDLGRTDKSEPAVDASDLTTPMSDANVKGRYPVHLHMTGLDAPDEPAMLVGNAVFGSPGWGIVHHASNAVIHANATYDTFGAGYVSETGNEIGAWTDNIAIYAKGISWTTPKNGSDLTNFDIAKTGDGFWFQGRMVEASGNVAASVNTGYVYFHRDSPEGDMLRFRQELFDYPTALGNNTMSSANRTPILDFHDNEVFAAREGLRVTKASPQQGHDIHSHMRDFTAWSVKAGAALEYTAHYILENFDLVGKDPEKFNEPVIGIRLEKNVFDVAIVNPKITNFENGIDLANTSTRSSTDPETYKYVVYNAQFERVDNEYVNYEPAIDDVINEINVEYDFRIELDHALVYGYDQDERQVEITGVKYDGLGGIRIPAGGEKATLSHFDVVRMVRDNGYYSTSDGRNITIFEAFYSDRLTGEVHKIGHEIELLDNVPLGNKYKIFADAKYLGEISADNRAAEAFDDAGSTRAGDPLVVDVLANDRDLDGDAIFVSDFDQPDYGQVELLEDGRLSFMADLGFTGVASFGYWVTDGFGRFDKGAVTVEVVAVDGPGAPPGGPGLWLDLDGPLVYGYASDARTVVIDGFKHDGLGVASLADEGEVVTLSHFDVVRHARDVGYYSTADGDNYIVYEASYVDRATGDDILVGHLIRIEDDVPLGNQYKIFRDAKHLGELNLFNAAPEAAADRLSVAVDGHAMLDVTANDGDPDGDALVFRGFDAPEHGTLEDLGDGMVRYRPDAGYEGVDGFTYWVTDGYGGYARGEVSVTVGDPEDGVGSGHSAHDHMI